MSMNGRLQDLIEASQELTPVEQVQLLSALTESLYHYHVQDQQDTSLQDSIHALNRTPPVDDLSQFVADFWPPDETADDLNDFIYQQRQTEVSADI